MNNPSIEALPGDILFGAKNHNVRGGARPHFIIFLSESPFDEDLFFGAMLTHSPFHGNIPLVEGHFVEFKEDGSRWQIVHDNSFISSDLYHKKNDWRPFTKVGQLSELGLRFVIANIGDKEPIFSPLNGD